MQKSFLSFSARHLPLFQWVVRTGKRQVLGTEVNCMNERVQRTGTDEDLIGILTAISVVSKRLARKLTLLAEQSQFREGGKADEQNERYGDDHRRTTEMCHCHQRRG